MVVLSLADWWTHSIRCQTADLREHLASDVGTDTQKIFFVEWSAAFGVFFSVRATIVASLDGQQDVQCSKSHLLAAREELNRRHARALSVSFERPRSPTWTSPQLTASAFLESSSLCHGVLCECHNNGRYRHERRHPFLELVPRSATHIVKVTGKRAICNDHTADSFSQSPMLSATRSPKQASEGAQNQTRE